MAASRLQAVRSAALARTGDASDATLVRLAAPRPVRRRLVRAFADVLAARDLGETQLGLTLTAPGRRWAYHLDVAPGRARARAGTGTGAVALGLEVGLADAVRVGLGRLDPGEALLARRLELTGDAVLAMRLADALGEE